MINLVFANTIKTDLLINTGDRLYIGTYHGGMDLSAVKNEIVAKKKTKRALYGGL